MRRSSLIILCFFIGCGSLHQDYVEAEAVAWSRFDQDNRLDNWIDASSLHPAEKDALHKLNTGRRARVAHALAEIHSGD